MKNLWPAALAGLFLTCLFSVALKDLNLHVDALQGRLAESDRKARVDLERLRDQNWKGLREVEADMTDARTELDALQARLDARAADIEALYRDVLSPSVQVSGKGGVGGGTILYSRADHTYAISAFHVLNKVVTRKDGSETRDPVEVKIYDGRGAVRETVQADLVAYDPKMDLALLRLRSSKVYPNTARLASRETLQQVTVFTPIYAVGCPLGHDPLPTLGEVATLHKEVNNEKFWMMNAPTIFGNSGGGIFHRETRELIGVSVMICTYDGVVSTPVPHLGILVSLERVYDWLDKLGYPFIYDARFTPEPASRLTPPRFGLQSPQ